MFTNALLTHAQEPRNVLISEAVLLGLNQHIIRKSLAPEGQYSFFLLNECLELLEEIAFYVGQSVNLVDSCALPQRLVNHKISLTRRNLQEFEQFTLSHVVEVLSEAQAVSVLLERTYSLLDSLTEILTDAHDFTDCPHLSP